MEYCVQLEVFAGPLDLLLHLLDEEKIDIHDIEIARITQQYLDYLAALQEHDLTIAGDFLVMAATLLQIKAGALLPVPDLGSAEEMSDAIYSRADLVQRLLLYRQFKAVANWLDGEATANALAIPRPASSLGPPGPHLYTNPIGQATIGDLLSAWKDVREAWLEREQVQQITLREMDLGTCMEQIRRRLQQHPSITFRHLLGSQPTRAEIIVTFIAMLELARLGAIEMQQKDLRGPITIATGAGMEAATESSLDR